MCVGGAGCAIPMWNVLTKVVTDGKKKGVSNYAHCFVQCHRGYRFVRTDDRDPRSHGYPEVSGSNPDVGKLDQTMHHILVHFLFRPS